MRVIPLTFRRRAAALFLLLIASASGSAATGGRWRRPAVQGDRANAPERTQGHRRPDRVSEPRQHPDPGADRLAQRGRTRQVGFRALLRAPDVPRHAGHPAGEVPRDHEQGRRAGQRQHRRRLARTTTPRSRRNTPSDPRALRRRFQHLAYSEADFKTEARAILGEYNKNSADPVRKLFEVQREHFFQAHTYKHTTMGFIADIENMPNEYEYSKVFFERWYRPQYTTIIVAGDVDARRSAAAGREILGRLEAGIRRRRPPSRRNRRRRGRSTSTCRGRATRCPTSRWRSRHPRSSRRARIRRRCTSSRPCSSARPPRSTRSSSSPSRKSTRSRSTCRTTSIRRSSRSSRG